MSKQNVTSLNKQRFAFVPHTAFAKDTVKTPVSQMVLRDILCRPRFSGTPGEQYVIDTYLKTIPGITEDGYANLWLKIPQADGSDPTTLFSSHTDTVHKAKAGNAPYKLETEKGMLSVKGGGVLGADDGTGIWIMLNLIKAKVPGLYIFHREEEIGGQGSSYIADHHASLLEPMKRAIAFDRKGTRDIITHQGGERCCSDTFAEAFADALNVQEGFAFAPDDTGSFTDTKNYTHLVAECTNLAVGYYDQHTTDETQDLPFVTRLVNRMIAIDFEALPTERDHTAPPEDRWSDWLNYRDIDDLPRSNKGNKRASDTDLEDLTILVEQYPYGVAELLRHLGFDAYELERTLEDM